jgi:hypothetical protein
MFPAGELPDEFGIARDPQPVRVNHHDVDRPAARVIENLFELRMDRRFAPRQLQHFGPTLHLHEPIDCLLHLLERKVFAPRAACRVAHRALEIAGRRDLNQTDARVLFVLGAQAAIERAAALRLDAELCGDLSRHVEFHLVEVANVGTDEILAHPVRRAALPEIDPSVPRNDLGRRQCEALRTQALTKSVFRFEERATFEIGVRFRSHLPSQGHLNIVTMQKLNSAKAIAATIK